MSLCASASGDGLGRKGSYHVKAREAVHWGCTCVLALFIGRVQVHRIRPTNTVPGAKVIRNTRPAASHRRLGRKDNYRSKAPKAGERGCTCARFRKGPGKLNTTNPGYNVTANQSEEGGVFGVRRPLVGGLRRACCRGFSYKPRKGIIRGSVDNFFPGAVCSGCRHFAGLSRYHP